MTKEQLKLREQMLDAYNAGQIRTAAWFAQQLELSQLAEEPPCPFHSAGNTGPCNWCEQ